MPSKARRTKQEKMLADALETIERARRGNRFRAPRPVDVAAIRNRMGMTQAAFARRFGFPVATLRHWERGNRQPHGASLVLLNVIANNPGAVMRVLGLEREPLSDIRKPCRRA